jgi:ribonuclease HI
MDDARIPRGISSVDRGGPVVVHFDGACQPPRGGGIAAFGYTIQGGGFLAEECGLATRPFSDRATNNVAEYVGAIRALEWLVAQGYAGKVVVRGDSQLIVRQMTGEYEVKAEHLRAYHERLRQLVGRFERVAFEWVPREENRVADELSKRAIAEARPSARAYRPGRDPTYGPVAEDDEVPPPG